jgi:hypothetical protein
MIRGRWIDAYLDFGWTSQKIAAPVIHQGTLHGYALPDRDIYVKAAAGARLGADLRHVPPPDPAVCAVRGCIGSRVALRLIAASAKRIVHKRNVATYKPRVCPNPIRLLASLGRFERSPLG